MKDNFFLFLERIHCRQSRNPVRNLSEINVSSTAKLDRGRHRIKYFIITIIIIAFFRHKTLYIHKLIKKKDPGAASDEIQMCILRLISQNMCGTALKSVGGS